MANRGKYTSIASDDDLTYEPTQNKKSTIYFVSIL